MCVCAQQSELLFVRYLITDSWLTALPSKDTSLPCWCHPGWESWDLCGFSLLVALVGVSVCSLHCIWCLTHCSEFSSELLFTSSCQWRRQWLLYPALYSSKFWWKVHFHGCCYAKVSGAMFDYLLNPPSFLYNILKDSIMSLWVNKEALAETRPHSLVLPESLRQPRQ